MRAQRQFAADMGQIVGTVDEMEEVVAEDVGVDFPADLDGQVGQEQTLRGDLLGLV